MTPTSKPCIKCMETKPLESFVLNWRYADGHTNKCKACANAEQLAKYHASRGKGRAEKSAAKRAWAETATEKPCKECKVVKKFSEFGVDPTYCDGHASKCKRCVSARYRADLEANPEKYKQRSAAQRAKLTRAQRDRQNTRRKAHRRTEAAKATEKQRRARPENRVKIKARMMLGNAVILGRVKRLSCEVCGDPQTQGHHDNYSKPLDVRWLCLKHHDEWHHRHKRTGWPHLEGPTPGSVLRAASLAGAKTPCNSDDRSFKEKSPRAFARFA